MNLIQELNYACNADIFQIAYTMKSTLATRDERNRVTLWLKKIIKCNNTMEDLRTRNEFLRNLAVFVQNGKLNPPFDLDPPKGSIKPFIRDLPNHDDSQNQDDEIMALLRFLPANDGGFLIPKPLPGIGAYCYIAATNYPSPVNK